MLENKSPGAVRGERGRKIELEQRQIISALIEESCAAGARLERAYEVIAISPRTPRVGARSYLASPGIGVFPVCL